MTADTAADASGSVLRTTARGSRRTVATQSPWRLPSAASPASIPRTWMQQDWPFRTARSGPPGAALGLTPDASLMQSAQGCPCAASHLHTVDPSQPCAHLSCRIQ